LTATGSRGIIGRLSRGPCMTVNRSTALEVVRSEEIRLPFSAGECFERLSHDPGVFFLDSGPGFGRLGRFSFLGVAPFLTLTARQGIVHLRRNGRERTRRTDPLGALRKVLTEFATERGEFPAPFATGGVGFLSYDLKNSIERLPSAARRDIDVPELHFAFYTSVLAFDHEEERVYLTSSGQGMSRKTRKRRGLDASSRLLRRLEGPPVSTPITEYESGFYGTVESNFTRRDYVRTLARTKEYIAAGDIFQANISQRFHARWKGTDAELYRALREANPAPFAACLHYPDGTVLSSSPERFLKLSGRHVETRPIKGTRRRTGEAEPDCRAAAELLASEKDNAELAMIVDLERNDLGRVCEYGSVRVTEPRVLETYPTVFHLAATVDGELHCGHDLVDLVRATFPGGSITGAPKIRAMQIIDELEPTARNLYTGSIGYIDFGGDADFNIAIRTMVKTGEDVYFQAGGGIVADSDPEAEYEETVDKARALMQALGAGEWTGGR
jgi:para-aminobenzoate synthetase component I